MRSYPIFLGESEADLILVSVLCSEMAGRIALLPLLPLPGGAEHRPSVISRQSSETRINSFPLVNNYRLLINNCLQSSKCKFRGNFNLKKRPGSYTLL